jgi:hypothetical protein
MVSKYRIVLGIAFLTLVGGCAVDRSFPTMAVQSSANAAAVTPTPVNRPRLYPRFHDLPDPAFVGQARVLKLAFADSETLIDVPESVDTALRNHWVALENYHRAKDERSNVAQATFDHSMAAGNLLNILESARIETSTGTTNLDKTERDDVIFTQVMLFSEFRNHAKND